MRQYAQYMLSCRLQQKIKKVPKAFALDTDKSILSQFEIETIVLIIMNDSNFVKRYFGVQALKYVKIQQNI